MIFCSRLGLFFFQLDIDQYMEYVEKVVPLSAQSILGNPDCTTKDLTATRGRRVALQSLVTSTHQDWTASNLETHNIMSHMIMSIYTVRGGKALSRGRK